MTHSGHRLRESLRHPVLDSDGHIIEFLPAVRDFLVEAGGRGLAERFDASLPGGGLDTWLALTPSQRRSVGFIRSTWWPFPARNSLDRATATLPALLHERLPELGIDLSVVYPTYALSVFNLDDEELRRASARAFNRYLAEVFGPFRDRLVPAAVIPMHTPEEAIAELEHCVQELGFRAAMLSNYALRPLPVARDAAAPARWMDCFGIDSAYDYDPVWRRCCELRIAPTFHGTGQGWGSRTSISSYVYNHIGNFAASAEATCKSLFLGGVPQRFPHLRFGFLEGGISWAASLLWELVGHWSKRNREALENYNPANLDLVAMRRHFERHGSERQRAHPEELEKAMHVWSRLDQKPETLDEFAESGVASVKEIAEIFATSFYFGCEGDDPLISIGFDRARLPSARPMNAVFGSDIGHWDVPELSEVLTEAYEAVESGSLDEGDFRALVWDNPRRFWREANADFFEGTVLEKETSAGD